MTTFVLVHGAWHGGWCWREVADRLRAEGHRVLTPTLTGLGERVHLRTPEVGLSTHIDDISNVLKWEELEDVVLCGHSYGGMVITGVADRMPEKLSALVYLDALVPKNGESVLGLLLPDRRKQFLADVAERGEGWLIPPVPAQFFGIDDPAAQARVDGLCVPMALRAFEEPIALTGAHREVPRLVYIVAGKYSPSSFQGYYAAFRDNANWETHSLPCGHDVMVVLPDELAAILKEIS